MEMLLYLLGAAVVGLALGRILRARGEDVIISDRGKALPPGGENQPSGCELSQGDIPESVRKLVREKKLIEAIKELRSARDIDLRQAKEIIDRLSLSPFQTATAAIPPPFETAPGGSLVISQEQADAIRELIKGRNKIEAIKQLRQLKNIGLKEARDEIERMAQQMGL